MYVVNKQFELLEFVLNSVYVELHLYCWVYVLVWFVWSCGWPWSACEVALLPCGVCSGCAVNVMRVLLFVM